MRTSKWLLAMGAVLSLLLLFSFAHAGSQQVKEYVLFAGNVDSTESLSPWIPCRDADRISIRTWSTHASFSSTNADSIYSDSIAVFKIAFSDTVSGYVGGSGNYPIAIDTTMITATAVVNADTTAKLVTLFHPPLQEALRSPANGGGIHTLIVPALPGAASSIYGDGGILPGWFRVLITPVRRNTASGGQSTEGKRTVGLKGLRMVARVVYRNK